MSNVQFYKQGPGAVDVDDSVMEPGWYWIRERESVNGPPIPYGKSTGPFRTKREAERDYRKSAATVATAD